MKVIRNKYIPLAGYKTVNLFGVLFMRPNAKLSDTDLNHEEIHSVQVKELLYLPFYLLYGLEWFIRLITYTVRFVGRKIRAKKRKMNTRLAYKKISFEKEAYTNEDNLGYLEDRKRFAWIKYL